MVEIGQKLPSVVLVDTEMKTVNISDVANGKVAVIVFFPGAFTSVCKKELCTFKDEIVKLNSTKANVIAVSVDGPFANKAFKEGNNLNFVVLSDYKRDAVSSFNVELNDFAGLTGYTVAKRSVFIADENGTIRYKWVSDDPAVEPDYAEIESELSKL